MDIQAIGSRAFTVYIPESELTSRHLAARTMTARDARKLVAPLIESDALGAVNLELYPGRHEILIFVSRSAGEPEFFVFPDVETLLAAAGSGIGGIASALFWYGGAYILAVWPSENRPTGALREFAAPLPNPGAYLLHLREHGKLLLDGDALQALRAVFGDAHGSPNLEEP